jgi:hypothetical protein
MTTSNALGAAIALVLLTAAYAPPATAEAGPGTGTTTTVPASEPDDGWRYSTYYLYPLTRHIEESGAGRGWRFALYPLTVVLDTVQLPLGAIAGLFGD